MGEIKLYRSVKSEKNNEKRFVKYRETMRPPKNVPFVIDNLWEWLRPERFPCRRLSVYASPTPEIALQCGPEGGVPFEIHIPGEVKIAQLRGYQDSKFHNECGDTALKVINLLNTITGKWWPNEEIREKREAGQIWLPCLTKSEMNALFVNIPELHSIKKEITSMIRYWYDVELLDIQYPRIPDKDGEIFFEAKDGYWLIPIS